MKKTLLAFILLIPPSLYGQIEITEEAVAFEEDFEWFLGTGFTPDGIPEGTMDSYIVSTQSNSGSSVDFGDNVTTGEFARGTSTGGASIAGGVYAFNTGSGNTAFGFKPSSAFYTPGSVTVVLQNKTPDIPNDPVDIVFISLQVNFDIWYNNTTDNVTTVDLLVSPDNINYTSTNGVNGEALSTPGPSSPGWVKMTKNYVITAELNGISVSRDAYYFLKWEITANNGETFSDEIAIDNFKIIANPPVIFTEILQQPTTIDANGDETAVEAEDEFIEFFVYDEFDQIDVVDLNGWKIKINGTTRHVFPPGSGLVPFQACVLFGGGTPMGDFGGPLLQTASTGGLSLPNSGDIEIVLTDDFDEEKASTIISTGTGLINDAWHRDGFFIAHSSFDTQDPKTHSPGKLINDNDIYLPYAMVWNNKSLSWVEYWDGMGIPAFDDINYIINGEYMFTAGDFICNNLTINGTLIVPNGGYVVVGNYIINPGIFTIESGGILQSSENTLGMVTIKRNSPWGDTDGKYSFIGSPVKTFILGNLGGSFHYQFDEPSNSYISLPSNTILTPGYGFTTANKNELVFVGEPNAGDITVPISKNTTGEDYNLLANPYAAPISYISFMFYNGPGATEAITGTIYIWDDGGSNTGSGSTSDFRTITAAGDAGGTSNTGSTWNDKIGSMQGFFVVGDITSLENEVIFKEEMWELSGNEDSHFFRKAETDITRFKLGISNGESFYETLVAFIDDATEGFDKKYDGPMYSVSEKAKIYSYIDDKKYSIQALPPVIEKQVIGLGIDIPEDGNYQLNLHSMENVDFLELYLYDLKTDQQINFRDNNFIYEFNAKKGGDQKRFMIIASTSKIMSLDESLERQFRIHYDNGTLNIFLNDYDGSARVSIYDLTGRAVNNFAGFFSQGYMMKKLNYSPNKLYLLTIEIPEKQFTSKFITK